MSRRILYVDCFSGLAGDMMLGALLHLGAPLEHVRQVIGTLDLGAWELEARPGAISGVHGIDVQVTVGGVKEHTAHHHGRFGHEKKARGHDHVHHGHDHVHHGHDHVHHGHDHVHHDHDHVHHDHDHVHHDHDHVHHDRDHVHHGHDHVHHGHDHVHHGHDHVHHDRDHVHHGHDHVHHGHDHVAHEHETHAGGHEPHAHGRSMGEIRAVLLRGRLPEPVLATALAAFERLAAAEGRVHGVPPDEVHFHEVGAIDAIVDIVGSAAALHALGVDEVVSAPPPLGRGFVTCAHGRLPLPSPATLEVLRGVPVRGDALEAELVTPTGAALLRAMATRFGPIPEMVVERTGYGLGDARWPDRPNLLRLVLGTVEDAPASEVLVEANIDDMSPQIYGPLFDALLADGAHDVWLCPVQMKKGRPGVVLSALAPPERRAAVVARILRETTTLGVRVHPVERTKLARRSVTVQTPWGPARVKQGLDGDRVVNEAPELEDCLALARAHGVPLKDVLRAARTPSPPTPDTEDPSCG